MANRTGVDVMAGRCEVVDGDLVVRHSPLRVVHPFALLVGVGTLLAAGYSLATGWTYVADGRSASWPVLLVVGTLTLGGPLVAAYRKDLLTDERIPLDAVVGVRVDEEVRRWYFKQRRRLPVVVVEYADGNRSAEYPVRLHARDTERELQALVRLFEEQGFRVSGRELVEGVDWTEGTFDDAVADE